MIRVFAHFSFIYLFRRSFQGCSSRICIENARWVFTQAAAATGFSLHLRGLFLHRIRLRGSTANDGRFPILLQRGATFRHFIWKFFTGSPAFVTFSCRIGANFTVDIQYLQPEAAQAVQLLQDGTSRHAHVVPQRSVQTVERK